VHLAAWLLSCRYFGLNGLPEDETKEYRKLNSFAGKSLALQTQPAPGVNLKVTSAIFLNL
jgi:hypothetical protein